LQLRAFNLDESEEGLKCWKNLFPHNNNVTLEKTYLIKKSSNRTPANLRKSMMKRRRLFSRVSHGQIGKRLMNMAALVPKKSSIMPSGGLSLHVGFYKKSPGVLVHACID
jgi:hypothetical protein